MYNGKRLAFDYGSVRIGVSTTDQSGILASPSEVLLNNDELDKNLAELISEISPAYIAVGLPKQLSGADGTKLDEVKVFIERIKSFFSGEVFGIDERLTTVSAASRLRETGRNSKDSKNLIDSASAVTILESALQLEKLNGLDKCKI